MGRIVRWVVVATVASSMLAAPVLAQPPPAAPPPPTEPPPLSPAAPQPQPQPPPTPTGPVKRCNSNLYLEPSLLFGGSRLGGAGRLHGAVGIRYSRCPTPFGPEGFRVMVGGFAQVGSETIGDAFTKGIEAEFNVPVGTVNRARLGGRLYYGTANHGLFIVGGGVRYRPGPVHFGFEVIYSSRSSEGQAAAVGAFGVIGLGGKAGAVVVGVIGVLALVALSQFNTT